MIETKYWLQLLPSQHQLCPLDADIFYKMQDGITYLPEEVAKLTGQLTIQVRPRLIRLKKKGLLTCEMITSKKYRWTKNADYHATKTRIACREIAWEVSE